MQLACADDLWDEFQKVARETLAEEVRELGLELRQDVQQELRRWLSVPVVANTLPSLDARHRDAELVPASSPILVKEPWHAMMPPKAAHNKAPPADESPVLNIQDVYPDELRKAGRGLTTIREEAKYKQTHHEVKPSSATMPGRMPKETGKVCNPAEAAPKIETRKAWSSDKEAHADSLNSKDHELSKTTSADDDTQGRRNSWVRSSAHFRTGQRITTQSGIGVWDHYKHGDMGLSEALRRWLHSEYFDYVMGFFLMANAIAIGVQVDHMAGQSSDHIPTSFRIVDGGFCLVFVGELFARMLMYGTAFFKGKAWQWNVFDGVVVSFQVIDEISKLFLAGTKVQKTVDSLGVLRMLRLARIIRLIRMVRLVPELKSMVLLISASMHAFLWTVALLLILIYCVAVYYTELSTEICIKNKVGQASQEVLRKNFGSVGTAILSLFQAISGGDDWRNFVDDFKGLGRGSHFINTFVFAVYIAFATLVMLNLVTGVFVEGAQRLIQEEKDGELIRSVRKLFNLTDVDLSGEISFDEFEIQMDDKRMEDFLCCVDLQYAEAKSLFKLLDADRSGQIDVAEFVQGCMRLRGPARSVDLSAFKYDFDETTLHWGKSFSELDEKIELIGDSVRKMERALTGVTDRQEMPLDGILV